MSPEVLVAIIVGVIAAVSSLIAIARSFRVEGKADASTAVDAMARLAGELRVEIDRKKQEFNEALTEKTKQCEDDLRRLQSEIDSLKQRLDNGGIPP